jgi:predicted TIM-barrel fold metal-dependent hydrolase
MSETTPVIDVHHHAISSSIRAAYDARAVQLPEWDIQSDREAMERLGVTGTLLSMPGSGTPEQVHQFNTFLAEFSREDPQHYGFLANLPYGDSEAALREIAYVLDTLKGDGFALLSNYNGIYLSDERMDAILAELHRRAAVVFVHPGPPAGDNLPLFGRDVSVYEFTFDTTRAIMDLIYTEKLRRYPNIHWVLAHAGGTIPYLAYRLSIAREWGGITQAPEEVLAALRTLYYDLALSTSPVSFQGLQAVVDPSHILFGSDFPMRPEKGVAQSLEHLSSYPGFQADEQRSITSETAQALFPRFRQRT